MKPQASFSVKQNNSVGSIFFKKSGCIVNLKSDKFNVKFKEHAIEDAEQIIYDFVGISATPKFTFAYD